MESAKGACFTLTSGLMFPCPHGCAIPQTLAGSVCWSADLLVLSLSGCVSPSAGGFIAEWLCFSLCQWFYRSVVVSPSAGGFITR